MIARLSICVIGAVFAGAAQSVIVCVPSAPAAKVGTSVTLSAWYTPPAGARPEFRWSVTTGSVRVGKDATVWDLKNARAGAASADVDALVDGVKIASCSLEVRIQGEQADKSRTTPSSSGEGAIALPSPGPAPGVVMSGRAFLTRGQTEPAGFGLYSYILFGSPPSAAERDQYVAIFDATLRLMRPLSDLAGALKPAQLNATFLPLKTLPTSDPDGKWLVDNYDYSVAAADLARAGIRGDTAGAYIVSVRTPLSQGSAAPPLLIQNLSHVPPSLASTWVTIFLNQAAQERFWNSNTIDGLLAKMRLAIALAAEGAPQIKTAIATLISVSK
jgi:hypothetical protein